MFSERFDRVSKIGAVPTNVLFKSIVHCPRTWYQIHA